MTTAQITGTPGGLTGVLERTRFRDWQLALRPPTAPGRDWTVHVLVPGGTCCAGDRWVYTVPPAWRYAAAPVEQFWVAWLRQELMITAVHMVNHELIVGGVAPFDPGRTPPIGESC
jgi:hypothetical protein